MSKRTSRAIVKKSKAETKPGIDLGQLLRDLETAGKALARAEQALDRAQEARDGAKAAHGAAETALRTASRAVLG